VSIDPRFSVRQTYSPEEVAAMLRISLATVYRWLDGGKLPEVESRPGRHRRVPVDQFHAMFPEIRRPLQQLSLVFAQ